MADINCINANQYEATIYERNRIKMFQVFDIKQREAVFNPFFREYDLTITTHIFLDNKICAGETGNRRATIPNLHFGDMEYMRKYFTSLIADYDFKKILKVADMHLGLNVEAYLKEGRILLFRREKQHMRSVFPIGWECQQNIATGNLHIHTPFGNVVAPPHDFPGIYTHEGTYYDPNSLTTPVRSIYSITSSLLGHSADDSIAAGSPYPYVFDGRGVGETTPTATDIGDDDDSPPYSENKLFGIF